MLTQEWANMLSWSSLDLVLAKHVEALTLQMCLTVPYGVRERETVGVLLACQYTLWDPQASVLSQTAHLLSSSRQCKRDHYPTGVSCRNWQISVSSQRNLDSPPLCLQPSSLIADGNKCLTPCCIWQVSWRQDRKGLSLFLLWEMSVSQEDERGEMISQPF